MRNMFNQIQSAQATQPPGYPAQQNNSDQFSSGKKYNQYV